MLRNNQGNRSQKPPASNPRLLAGAAINCRRQKAWQVADAPRGIFFQRESWKRKKPPGLRQRAFAIPIGIDQAAEVMNFTASPKD